MIDLGFEPSLIRSFGADTKIGGKNPIEAGCLVISSETAQRHLGDLSSQALPLAILFDRQDTCQLALQRILTRNNCLAFVEDGISAERVRLVADCPTIDASSTSTRDAISAFFKNHLFLHDTRSTQELKRSVPEQVVKTNDRHVLMQVDSFTQGGMENVVIDLSVSLEAAGYRVTILNQGDEGDSAEKARESGLRIVSKKFKTPNQYVRFLKTENVDLVNGHYSVYGASSCKQLGIPFIETIHNSYVWFSPADIDAYRAADPNIENYVCVSKTSARYTDMVMGLDAKKIRVIPNGISASNIASPNATDRRTQLRDKWGAGEGSSVFLNVASIMASKAQLPLVKAFRRVVDTDPSAILVLLGNTEMEPAYCDAIKETIGSLGLESNVFIAGYQRDVASHYMAADVFVLPSYWEGWSLSLGEAVLNGLPCVITKVGSAYEFEDLENVFTVAPPFGDPVELKYENLARHVYGEDLNFEASLSEAMGLALDSKRRAHDPNLAQRLDSVHAYRAYGELFNNVINKTRSGKEDK